MEERDFRFGDGVWISMCCGNSMERGAYEEWERAQRHGEHSGVLGALTNRWAGEVLEIFMTFRRWSSRTDICRLSCPLHNAGGYHHTRLVRSTFLISFLRRLICCSNPRMAFEALAATATWS